MTHLLRSLRSHLAALLPAVVLVAAVTVACSGSSGAPDDTSTGPDLAALIPPQQSLGAAYAHLTPIERSSGRQSNVLYVKRAPHKDAADAHVKRFGRINGYAASYQSEDALLAGTGAWNVDLSVTLYKDPKRASGALQENVREIEEQTQASCEPVGPAADPATRPVGEESYVVAYQCWYADVPLYFSEVTFRDGRLTGHVRVGHVDRQSAHSDAYDLATMLSERIAQTSVR